MSPASKKEGPTPKAGAKPTPKAAGGGRAARPPAPAVAEAGVPKTALGIDADVPEGEAASAPAPASAPAVAGSPLAVSTDLVVPVDSSARAVAPLSGFPASGSPAVAAAVAAGTSNESVQASEPMIRKAAALRTKYKRAGGPIRLPVEQVGFHPANRDGQPPNGSRCLELCKSILEVGFDWEEANAGGIVVASIPGDDALRRFNQAACEQDPLLAPVVAGMISYGSLSHSHLHQILRNVKGGLCVDLPAVTNSEGKLSLERVRAIDDQLALAVDQGLLWEILDPAIETEEPDGCAIIQAAMNCKNSMCLVRHEMQALASLLKLTLAPAVAGRALHYESIRKRMQLTLPEFANDEAYIHLFQYVVDLGSSGAPFLPDLQSFHAAYVDPGLRRLRLGAFGAMNALPGTLPHLKVAGIKWAYSTEPKANGFCEGASTAAAKKLTTDQSTREVAEQAEEALAFFHVHCLGTQCRRSCGASGGQAGAQSLQEPSQQQAIQLLGNLDKEMFQIAIGAATGCDSAAAKAERIRVVAGVAYRRLRAMAPKRSFPNLPFHVPEEPHVAAAFAASKESLAPKVIEYVEGRPVTFQDSVSDHMPLETFAWAEFMSTSEFDAVARDEVARSAVFSAVGQVSRQLADSCHDLLRIHRGGEHKRIRVVAAQALKAGQLRLPPMLSSQLRIVASAAQGWAPPVQVRFGGFDVTMYLAMTASFPPRRMSMPLPSALAVAGNGPALTAHEWKPSHFPAPFWAVHRKDAPDGTNCRLLEVEVSVVQTYSANADGDPIAQTMSVTIPTLVASEDVPKGAELVAFWPQRVQGKAKAVPKRTTWVQHATKKRKL